MDKKQFSQNVKDLRNKQGLTQEQLAEKSGLSLRTIQRIEGGEVTPRSDTIIMLSNTFGVSPAELADWSLKEDRGYLALLNLSSLCFLLFPVLGIILPLVLWTSKKDKIQRLDECARNVINFQITWILVLFLVIIWQLLGMINAFDQIQRAGDISPSLVSGALSNTFRTFGWVYAYNVVFIILNTILSAFGKKEFYFPRIPFLR